MGRVLPAAAAGNGVDGCVIVRIDGGDGVTPPARVQLVCETRCSGRGARSRES